MNVLLTAPYLPIVNDVIELKVSSRAAGIAQLSSFISGVHPDTSFSFTFFPNVNVLLALKMVYNAANLINIGTAELANNFVDYYGYDWLKIHTGINGITKYSSPRNDILLNNQLINTGLTFSILEGDSTTIGSIFLIQYQIILTHNILAASTLLLSFNPTYYKPILNPISMC